MGGCQPGNMLKAHTASFMEKCMQFKEWQSKQVTQIAEDCLLPFGATTPH